MEQITRTSRTHTSRKITFSLIIDVYYYFFGTLQNPTGALDLPTLKQSNMDAKDTTVEARRMRYASCGPCGAGRQFYGGTTKMLLT